MSGHVASWRGDGEEGERFENRPHRERDWMVGGCGLVKNGTAA